MKVPEGVAAPLEPSARSPLMDLGPIYEEVDGKTVPCQATKRSVELIEFIDEFTKDCEGLTEVDKVLMAEIAQRWAAAVSKNLQEELARIINPIFDEDAQKWTLREKLESVVRVDKLMTDRVEELEKSEAELEEEIAALRKAKI